MSARLVAAWLAVPARWYLGGLFVFASLHKIAVPHDFAVDIATYEILPLAIVNPMAIALPWIELAVGLMLLTGTRIRAGALLVAAMMLIFIGALGIALTRGLDMSCGCFASQGAEDDPISWITIIRDSGWLAMALLVLFFDKGLVGVDRLLERSRADA